MKNESDYLRATPSDTGTLTAPDPTIVHMPLYRKGSRVLYQGQYCTVSHVVLARSQLLVHLDEMGSAVDTEKVQLAPTRILLQRS